MNLSRPWRRTTAYGPDPAQVWLISVSCVSRSLLSRRGYDTGVFYMLYCIPRWLISQWGCSHPRLRSRAWGYLIKYKREGKKKKKERKKKIPRWPEMSQLRMNSYIARYTGTSLHMYWGDRLQTAAELRARVRRK